MCNVRTRFLIVNFSGPLTVNSSPSSSDRTISSRSSRFVFPFFVVVFCLLCFCNWYSSNLPNLAMSDLRKIDEMVPFRARFSWAISTQSEGVTICASKYFGMKSESGMGIASDFRFLFLLYFVYGSCPISIPDPGPFDSAWQAAHATIKFAAVLMFNPRRA